MKFYFLQTTGDLNNENQLFLESPPEEMGILDYYTAVGKRLGRIFSGEALTLHAARSGSGCGIHHIIVNSRGYFLGSEPYHRRRRGENSLHGLINIGKAKIKYLKITVRLFLLYI
ncbi:MAG: hypothetical protein CVV44_09305 [Spirochaetae bacterium HGW-Spirochaetae-1]|nr:MAG: hypothetical protein CVV44_09305 [Spirochaetae bacterium HGW-Spirochaetae-1]